MENNFDENKSEKTSFLQREIDVKAQAEVSPEENTAGNEAPVPENTEQSGVVQADAAQPQLQTQYGAARDTQGMPDNAPDMYGAYYGQPVYGGTYTPPPAFRPQQVTPAAEQKKRRFTGVPFWLFVSVITVMFIIITLLCAGIALNSNKKSDPITNGTNIGSTAAQSSDNRPVIRFEAAEKPVLEDDMYADKETGLLTTVGVAQVILPSQVKINIFGDIPYTPIGDASGVILTENGYILTNAHVVADAERFSVMFYDGTEEEAYVVGSDTKSDIAVIKVSKSGLQPAQLGTSSGLKIGEEVALAGACGGFQNTVNYGHISGLDRRITTSYSRNMTTCIQCDVAHNAGNSGGALVNMYGQVIGIPVANMPHEEYENIGFSIAIDDVIPIAEELIANGYVSTQARIGIEFLPIGDEQANSYGLSAGICVLGLDASCSAAYSGIEKYDVITYIDGQRIFTADDVYAVLKEHVPGDVVEVIFVRKNVTGDVTTLSTEVTLADYNPASQYFTGSGNAADGSEGEGSDTNDAP